MKPHELLVDNTHKRITAVFYAYKLLIKKKINLCIN